MARRRRRRRKISKKERQELCRNSRNRARRNRYALKQKAAFLDEYAVICKRYGCCIEGNLKHIRKNTKEDRPDFINTHLESLVPSLQWGLI